MKRKRARYATFNWLKFIVIVVLLIVLLLVTYLLISYNLIMKTEQTDLKETEQYVLAETGLESIYKTYRYQELDEYHIVYGKGEKNENQFVFVPISNYDEKLTIINETDIINEEEMKKEWRSTCKSCKFISIKPAILDNIPLWELIFYDESSRYVTQYLSMYDGSELETTRYKQNFK